HRARAPRHLHDPQAGDRLVLPARRRRHLPRRLGGLPRAHSASRAWRSYARLMSDDPEIAAEAARAWSVWEGSTSCLFPNAALVKKTGETEFALAFAR